MFKKKGSGLNFFWFDFFKKHQQNDAHDDHVDTDILWNRPAFVDCPPGILERIVIAQKFDKKAQKAVEY